MHTKKAQRWLARLIYQKREEKQKKEKKEGIKYEITKTGEQEQMN